MNNLGCTAICCRTRWGVSVEKLRSQIADGTFPAGSRLPSTRSLAVELGVSRTTVTAVYEQLAAEGYLETSQRAKARVAPGVTPANAAPRKADLVGLWSASGRVFDSCVA